MSIFSKLKQRFVDIKTDKNQLVILLLHLQLAACHLTFNLFSDIQYYAELRASGCILIALFILFFGRQGMAYGFVIYACALIYINTFYNYGTIFFLLIAYGAYPRIKWPAIIIYALNVFISFSLQKLIPIAILIHFVYLGLFVLITLSIYKVKPSKNLNLKNDERFILDQLLAGKLQKEIEEYSQQTITAKLKNAKERNMCDSTTELITAYALESGVKLGKCGKPCKKTCPKHDICCTD